jgi:hypothetical protein
VLYPNSSPKEAPALAAWVRDGGLLLLADESGELARQMGIPLAVHYEAEPGPQAASGLGVQHLIVGGTFVRWTDQPGDVLVRAGGQPVVTRHPWGDGEVWLVNRPEMLTNRRLPQADNAVLVCRLASAMLEEQPGRLAVDEYFHGLRDRPGVTELLLEPPAVWVTVHGVLLLGLLLWHHVPRFGTVRPLPPPTRRSKEEFLMALASLLERKQDYPAAFAAVRDGFAREVQHALGLPAGVPTAQVVREAARRRPIDVDRWQRVLTGAVLPPGAGARAFLHALNEVEAARHEFDSGR